MLLPDQGRKSRLMTQDQKSLRQSIMLGDFVIPERKSPEKSIKEHNTKLSRSKSTTFHDKKPDSMRKRAILQNSQNNSNTNSNSNSNSNSNTPSTTKPNKMYAPVQAPVMKHLQPTGRPKPVQPRNHRPDQRHSFYSHSQFSDYPNLRQQNNGVVRSHSHNSLRPQSLTNVKPVVPNLTPYQQQKQKMRTRFQFDNGEVFIPRREQKVNSNGERANPYAYVSKTPQNEQPMGVTKVVATPTTVQRKQAGTGTKEKEKEKKKLGSFFKRLFKSKDTDDESDKENRAPSTYFVAPEPAVTVSPAALLEDEKEPEEEDVYNRLVKQWKKVHYIAPEELNSSSRSSSNQSSILTSSLPETSQLTIPSLPGDNANQKPMNLANIVRNGLAVTMSKRLRFSSEVYLTDTWAAEVYERSDDIFLDNFIEVESPHPLGNENGANTTTQKPEIKREINEFKRKEMMVHENSRHMTHFYT